MSAGRDANGAAIHPDAANGATESAPARRFVTTTVEVEGRDEVRVVEIPDFEPAPWGPDAELLIVGQRVPRVDAAEKVTGRARYTVDVRPAGMLHAVLVRAALPRGRATVDVEPAREIAGVVDAITVADLPKRIRAGGVALFDPDVGYAGQPLAAICAESEEAAWRGARAVAVEWEPLPFAVTLDDAQAPGAPRVRPGAAPADADPARPVNLMRGSPHVFSRGDVEAGLREAEVVLERTYRTPAALHTAMEPHAAVAEWDGERLTVWESTQGIFAVRAQVATALGLTLARVRVRKEHMGGGFGAKNSAGAHTFAAALFAMRTGRPVRCVNDREAEQVDTGHRPSTVQRVTLGARRDGRLVAIACDADVALGIGGWEAGPTRIFHELYACPNVHTVERFTAINAQALAAFRAPGHVEGAFALERAMDELARQLGIDPLELRRRNFAGRDAIKDRPYSANGLLACYEEGARRFGWEGRGGGRGGGDSVVTGDGVGASVGSGGAPRVVPTALRRGFGVAAQVWGTGGGPPAYAIVRLNPDGSTEVQSGTQDLGTGARTILAQIAAEALGARLADVRVSLGDTDGGPYTGNSWGSMTTASVGPAVRMAAEDARHHLLEAAAELLGADPAALVARDSTVTAPGGRTITFREIGKRLGDVMIIGRGSRGPNPAGVALMTFGVQFAEVEVDAETGIVRVVRLVAVHDAGRIINPLLAESQLEGGILQGIGYALTEERVLDRRLGLPLNPTTHDYKIPTFADVPVIDATCLVTADPVANHTGARGLAEPPIIPTAPAIANAVADALGIEPRELPLTPWRVLAARGPAGDR